MKSMGEVTTPTVMMPERENGERVGAFEHHLGKTEARINTAGY